MLPFRVLEDSYLSSHPTPHFSQEPILNSGSLPQPLPSSGQVYLQGLIATPTPCNAPALKCSHQKDGHSVPTSVLPQATAAWVNTARS